MNQFDILIVGTGVSGMASLNSILLEVNRSKLTKPLHIAVLEQQSCFWNGVAFGSKSSVNGLIITTVAEFISDEQERQAFISWLNANREDIIQSYIREGGAAARQWVKRHHKLIALGSWDTLHIPRYWYSDYMAASLQLLIQQAVSNNKIYITKITGEAVHATRNSAGDYNLVVKNDTYQQTFSTHKLILAIGSPPVKALPRVEVDQQFPYIKNMYAGSISSMLNILTNRLQAVAAAGKINVLVVGSNACCAELLYLFRHHRQLHALVNQITVLSPSGALPSAIIATPLHPHFKHLDALGEQQVFTYTQLIEATVADLKIVTGNGVNTATVALLVNQAMELKQRLSPTDLERFQVSFGPAVSSNIRRMGDDYYEAISKLVKEDRIKVLKGKFNAVQNLGNNTHTAVMSYLNEHNEVTVCNTSFSAIINCTGFQTLNQCSSLLINSLINEGLCQVNASGKGFEVSESFEAAKNLYIMGPLLASNNNKNIHFWHVENVSRILQLAPLMSRYIIEPYKDLMDMYYKPQLH